MNWFEQLTGFREESPEQVRQHLCVNQDRLRSNVNNREWCCGILETPTLAELRERARQTSHPRMAVKIHEVVANVQALHRNKKNTGAMFQVASQFNLLEMAHPDVTPEEGVGIYQHDCTQGPACAIAAGAGTIFRNYFAPVNGKIGQTSRNQIDCLEDISRRLGNVDHQLWDMVNGYAFPSHEGLDAINANLKTFSDTELDELRGLLRIGLHTNTQVTLRRRSHTVSQAYCSAMPVAYSGHLSEHWEPFATLILEAAYEACICAAMENAARTGNNRLYLTLLGGGVFGNPVEWILDAISRAISLYPDCGLDIAIVSHRRSKSSVQRLTQTLTSLIHDQIK